MKILALECSAGPASVAVSENGKILASDFTNVALTHSQTLMPMLKSLLDKSGLSMKDIDAIAISCGPGSFTGIRIGISALKGLAAPRALPCYGVSTLRAIAENKRDFEGIIAAVMDARCNQVYNALFRAEGGKLTRLCDDRALMTDELLAELDGFSERVVFVGDGARLFECCISDRLSVAEGDSRYQSAVGVALAAEEYEPTAAARLMPFYLRLPQAERELRAKKGE